MLRPLISLGEEDISEDSTELYELRRTTKRLDEYLATNAKNWSTEQRLDHVRALLAPFSELHGLGIGHRDIDCHNLWYASDQKSIIASGFAASFFPEKGTIGDLRDILKSTDSTLPEDEFIVDGEILDPFRQDVFLLAQVAYQICFSGQIMPRENNIPVWTAPKEDPFDGKLNSLFAKALDWEAKSRYATAAEMLAELNAITLGVSLSYDDTQEVIDEIMHGSFVKREWSPFTLYQNFPPLPGENLSAGNKLSYRYKHENGIGFCKYWQKAYVGRDTPGMNRRILRLRKRIETANNSELPIPKILDYGLLESGGFFISTLYEEGESWRATLESLTCTEEKLVVAENLVSSVIKIHNHGLAHGDLHPENIIFKNPPGTDTTLQSTAEKIVTLIDIIDFGDNTEPYNVAYGPKNPAATDSFGRDRYAVYKLVDEILNSSNLKAVNDELLRAIEQTDSVPVSLDPLLESIKQSKAALIKKDEIPSRKSISLTWNHSAFPLTPTTLEPDGNAYHFNCKWDIRAPEILNCYITSTNIVLSIALDPEQRQIRNIKLINDIPLSELVSASNKAQSAIKDNIVITQGVPCQETLSTFINFIFSLEPVIDALDEKYSSHEEAEETEDQHEHISPRQIWSTLLEKEGELLIKAEIIDDDIEESQTGRILIPYALSHGDTLDFDIDDQVFISFPDEENSFGELDLLETSPNFLAIKPTRRGIRKKLKKGLELALESLKNKASRDRRKRALEKVLSGDATISSLPAYFDASSETKSKQISPIPTEALIRSLYDSMENSSEELNEKQITAFQRVLSEGPISVLQGPPGTGKTAFVSKLIHFLFAHGGAKNILLVGQSHTAVDNVAIKAREVCTKHNTEVSIVRLGQEQMIDEELLHAHPGAIQRQIRHKFHREYDQRVNSLASRLLLPKDLVEELSKLHRSIHPMMDALKSLTNAQRRKEPQVPDDSETTSDDPTTKSSRIQDCVNRINNNIISRYSDLTYPNPMSENFWEELSTRIALQFGVNNPVGLRKLNKLLKISQEWIDVLSTGEANYDKFLVKTSQLVCGTLVGMGKKRLSIEESEFDWVIVDEAGRAQASELMIPLQSAKRILLVGDHRQLPPYYEKNHVKAVSNKLGISTNEVTKTDFERAFVVNNGIALNTQYRMVKPIGDIISNCFYKDTPGGLSTGRGSSPSWYDLLPTPWNVPVIWIDSGIGEFSSGDEEVTKGKLVNRHEVKVALEMLKSLTSPETISNLRSSVTKEQPYPIGIITMYRAQKELFEHELSKTEWASPIRPLIKIDTVDSYQGQENKIIILSLVRDNINKNQGFLGDQPRINVSLSRAQERLIVIGARRMWNKSNSDSALSLVLNFIEEQHAAGSLDYEITDGTTLLMGNTHV
jgi:tRNA A-37 threonylcarbamoyl transferase component Bud32/signal recognition particle GTPase